MLVLLLALAARAETVSEAFPPPAGAARVHGDAFGSWLGTLPLRPADVPVHTYDGRVVRHHARVVDLPLVRGDLQQCADSALRLRATWLVEHHLPVSFHATSGDELPWSRYRDGERASARDGHLEWHPARSSSFEQYLAALFTWAGTRSLFAFDTVPTGALVAGDLLVAPGSPGHAVVVLDVATDGARTWVLVGEGYMPAQDFHVELGPEGGWWPWGPGVDLGHWAFEATDLRAWKPVPGT